MYDTLDPDTDLSRIMRQLARDDRALRLDDSALPAFRDRQIRPSRFSEQALFAGMARQEVQVFSNFPAPFGPETSQAVSPLDALVDWLSDHADPSEYPIRFGRNDEVLNLSMAEIMRRWCRGASIFGITDLPVRGTALAAAFSDTFLDAFNLMPRGSAFLRELEILTAVISKAGKVTDSHSDDFAVCNHCFTGQKLWLVWDTFQGQKTGLQDVEREEVFGHARFDMDAFLATDSARWFLIGPGETLFLPGLFTHRVTTTADYIGVGSFYVGLPNVLHSMSRWAKHGSLWDGEQRLADQVSDTALKMLDDPTLKGRTDIATSVAHWQQKFGTSTADLRAAHPFFEAFLSKTVGQVSPARA